MTFSGRISALSQRLAPSTGGLWAVHELASEQYARGEDVYLLSVGDPDLATLPSTVRAAIDSLEKGRTHYAPGRGEPGLRRIIAEIEIASTGKQTEPDNIIIFPGATNAIFSVLSCLLDPGDEVIVAEPMYIGYDGIFKALNANVVSVPLLVDQNFALDVDGIKAAVSPNTNVVFLNTPGNPAGNMITAAQLEELAAFCRERDIWLVCDEVYSMITFDEYHVSLRKAARRLDNIVVIDGLSKSHAMTGWRLGWTVASKAFSQHLLEFTSSTVFGCCQFVQDAAAHALTNDEEYIRGVREEYRQRRNYVCSRVAKIPGLSCDVPQAGMFIMMRTAELAEDGLAFAEDLLASKKVSVLPGAGFGASTRDYVRVSLAQPVTVLKPALDRIEAYAREKAGGSPA
jgi:arginine:pyruvate transaminase